MSAPLKLLILEDEPIVLLDLKMAVEDEGMVPLGASRQSEALDLIAREAPDAAILDVSLGRSETCWPVADRLDELGIPYLLHTGDLDRQGERIQEARAPVILKPSIASHIVQRARDLATGG